MPKTIWKFELKVDDDQVVKMPKNAGILSVQTQANRHSPLKASLCVWALVDPSAELCDVHFKVKGTGHPCDDLNGFKYIGTVQFHDGQLVFHVFCKGQP